MTKTLVLLPALLYLLFYVNCCAQSPTVKEKADKILVDIYPDSSYHFEELAAIIGDKKIVALGESSHGLGKYYELKTELVKYLHSELGFEILAMEGGLGDVNLTYSNVDSLSAEELMKKSVFGNFRSKESMPLFDYIKKTASETSPLIYTGFDTQTSSSYFTDKVKNILNHYDAAIAEKFENNFPSYYQIYQSSMRQDSVNYNLHLQGFMNSMKEVEAYFSENEKQIKDDFQLSAFDFEVISRTLNNFQKAVDFPFAARMNEEGTYKGMVLRDELMYENLVWLAEEIFPDKKIIIWGHNGHIDNKPTLLPGSIDNASLTTRLTKWMGHHLKEKYKDQYYSIGLFAYKGSAYQFWTKKSMPFENSDSTFIESILLQPAQQMTFMDLQNAAQNEELKWIGEPVRSLEFENGGVVEFIPEDRFDALIHVYESGPPTFQD